MKRREWTDKQKVMIVLEGVKANVTVADICNRHGIHQVQYQKWKKEFLENAPKAFSFKKEAYRERVLEKKISRMEKVIGQLTMDLKKTEELL